MQNNPSTGAIPGVEEFRAHVARSALKADPYDPNDYPWQDLPWLDVLPSVDLSARLLEIEDQMRQGSCVSNSGTSGCELFKNMLHGSAEELARDYDYYRGRDIDPATAPPKDGGMTLKQGWQSRKRWGICLEKTRPYSDATYNDPPTPEQDAEAAQHRVTKYVRLKGDRYQDSGVTIRRIKEALTLGYPVQVGMVVENAFFDLKGPCNGRPYNYGGMSVQNAVAAGGHAMLIPGYCQRGALDWHKYANSWGKTWGDEGFALLPMMIAAGSDCFDIWAVTEFDGVSLGDPATIQAHDRVSRLYVSMFGRAPDAEGLAYWAQRHVTGEPLGSIAAAMYAVDPARQYYPLFLTNQEIAAAFYVNVLGRQPDADGLSFWSQQLNLKSPGEVIQDMVQATAFYDGADPAGAASSDHFNRRVRVARLYAEKGGDIAGAHDAIANVN